MDQYLTVSYSRNLQGQNAIDLIPEISTNLQEWTSLPDVVFVSEIDHLNGTSTVTYRSAAPIGSENQSFIRVRATQ